MNTLNFKKEKTKLSPEERFTIFMECSQAGAPVKQILEKHGLNPWELAEIRKRIREAALEALSIPRKRGARKHVVSIEEHHSVSKELENAKDALAAVGHELALLKKRVNSD